MIPAMSTTAAKSPRRALFDDDHELFRESFRRFLDAEVVPYYDQWERDGIVPREVFSSAGKSGFLGMAIPAEFGGGGVSDFRFNTVIAEEVARTGTVSFGINLHNDVCLPYFLEYTNEDQQRRWLPGLASGELIAAVAMTEPGTGSDLAGIKTTATRNGDDYILNGSKTFISNGLNADLVIVAAVVDDAPAGRSGLSLLIVERDTPGFERGRNLDKIGMHAQDTAELFFHDARVPAANLLGEPGSGLTALKTNLAQERMTIAVAGIASAKQALDWAVEYVKERNAFGRPISDFQNTKFVLASVKTETEVVQSFVDDCVRELVAGTLTADRAAMAKLAASELQGSAVDRCLQLFGGYGYMTEYPIARAYVDARIGRIYGGTSEIMRQIISKSMGL
ncbi:acyl-CoA dehydrogenase family protein [Mycolicibacterium bacteremicum]|uniref:Acyl-CoA dehydrogenase n=2 Tax=Mycolicibacterium bacteremicum TaxID=564198 RepID=A0A1W9YWT2_MYCBA|nr:acyl-CoA dehydrogenase family protein [Mycolicibacterium bacteremicum]ORA04429.1 acyl-CoA dehydrogenase [Mycolicibacterium bacteremicum]